MFYSDLPLLLLDSWTRKYGFEGIWFQTPVLVPKLSSENSLWKVYKSDHLILEYKS